MAEQNLFEEAGTPTAEEQNASFLEKYVGEGKKYKDAEELAKAYEHANAHIPKLNEDLTSMREFMAAQFEQMNERRQTPPVQNVETPGNEPDPVAPPNGSGEEDLDARIAKILEERDETSRLKGNAELAQEVMIEHFGDKAAAVEAVRLKAEELGVSPQFLADTAFRSPKALFNIMGINPDEKPRNSSTPAPRSDVNTNVLDKMTSVKQGTYKYYDQLRRSDPKRYWSEAVQSQLMKDAMDNKDFYR